MMMTDIAQDQMRQPTIAANGKIDLGEVRRLTYGTFWQAPWRFIAFELIWVLVSILGAIPKYIARDDKRLLISIAVVLTIAQSIVQIIGQNAAIYAAGRQITGAPFTMGKALRVGGRRLLPMVGLGILIGCAIAFGFVLLIIPGLIAVAVLAVAAPVCMIEGLGPFDSMARSAFLTKGNRWNVVGAVLLILIGPLLAVVATIGAIAAVSIWINATALFAIIGLLTLLLILALPTIATILMVALLAELRRAKGEGLPHHAVASVFD